MKTSFLQSPTLMEKNISFNLHLRLSVAEVGLSTFESAIRYSKFFVEQTTVATPLPCGESASREVAK